MKILVAGGGTGGHIVPNIALLDELKKEVKDLEVLYIGSKGGMEAEMVPKHGWKFRAISCGKLRRYFSWKNFLDVFKTVAGVAQSVAIIRSFRPEVIFCKGGYVSLPVALAGGMMGKAVVIHESDLKMGLANRLAARSARVVCVSFPETVAGVRGNRRVVLTGNPVRAELRLGVRARGFAFAGLREGKKVILVMGGSQGAELINELIWKNLEGLTRHYQVVHACGKGKVEGSRAAVAKLSAEERKNYFACEFLGEELKDVFAITDLMISRAGANSLAEIEFLGIPAVLVPLVQASRGDQVDNAESFVKNHQAIIIEENPRKPVDLLGEIERLLKMGQGYSHGAAQANHASAKNAKILIELAKKQDGKKT